MTMTTDRRKATVTTTLYPNRTSVFRLSSVRKRKTSQNLMSNLQQQSTTHQTYQHQTHQKMAMSQTILRRPSLTTLMSLLFLTVFNWCALSSMATAAAASGDFDISKLIEYNSLANCIGKIHKDFEKCNTQGAEKAKGYISKVELGEEWSRRLKCCGMWKLRDCWMNSARAKCNKAQAEQIFKLPHLFMPGLADECSEYTPESGKCTVPMWLIASVVSGVAFVLIILVCGLVYCIHRARRSRHRRRTAARGHHSHGQRSGHHRKPHGNSHHHHNNQRSRSSSGTADTHPLNGKCPQMMLNGCGGMAGSNGKLHSHVLSGHLTTTPVMPLNGNGGTNGGLAPPLHPTPAAAPVVTMNGTLKRPPTSPLPPLPSIQIEDESDAPLLSHNHNNSSAVGSKVNIHNHHEDQLSAVTSPKVMLPPV